MKLDTKLLPHKGPPSQHGMHQVNEHHIARLRKPDAYHERFSVPGERAPWSHVWPEYAPYPALPRDALDLEHIAQGTVLFNPCGRTGLIGRGALYHWGANKASDLILVRKNHGTPEFLAILRKRDARWAIPGGFQDPGESAEHAARRELQEEAFHNAHASLAFLDTCELRKIYEGYVDDSRNTDNAWVESSVFLAHASPEIAQTLHPSIGPEASAYRWMPFHSPEIEELFAMHAHFIKCAIQQGAHL